MVTDKQIRAHFGHNGKDCKVRICGNGNIFRNGGYVGNVHYVRAELEDPRGALWRKLSLHEEMSEAFAGLSREQSNKAGSDYFAAIAASHDAKADNISKSLKSTSA